MIKLFQRVESHLVNIENISQFKNYLPLTGGKLTNSLAIDSTQLATIDLRNPNIDLSTNDVNPTSMNYVQVRYLDKNNKQIGSQYIRYDTQSRIVNGLYVGNRNKETNEYKYSELSILAMNTGEFWTQSPGVPDSRVYSNQVANTVWCTSNFRKSNAKEIRLYVDEINGSDTSNLHIGRGLSPELPFKTLYAAFSYFDNYYSASQAVYIYLMSDITIPATNKYWYGHNFFSLYITSNNTNVRTIHLNNNIQFEDLRVNFSNINFVANSTIENFITSYVNAYIAFHAGVSMNGTVSLATLKLYSGIIEIVQPITGTVTGRKYYLMNNSRIISNSGPDGIPGTLAGTISTTAVIPA